LSGLSGLAQKSKETINKIDGEDNKPTVFLRAIALNEISDLEKIKNELNSGKILIIKITPLAKKSIEDVKNAVNQLCNFVESKKGDIARLGEERIVICPTDVKIWREKKVSNDPISKTP
jgi:SepF-like predicted cell division protein (DUF552 family)